MALTHRLQILLDDDRYQRIVSVAANQRVSVAAVIRDAIDRGVPAPSRERRAAGDAILAAEPMPVPDRLEDFLAELEDLRSRRA